MSTWTGETLVDRQRPDLMFRLRTIGDQLDLRIFVGNPSHPDEKVYLWEEDLIELYKMLRPHLEWKIYPRQW